MAAVDEKSQAIRDQILENQTIIDELNEKLARKSEEVKIIQQISSEINATLELDKILDIILASMESVLGFAHCMILLSAADAEKLTLVASRGYEDSGVGVEVPFGQGVIGVVAKKRRMMRMGNIQTQLKYQANVRSRVQALGQEDQLQEAAILPGLAEAQSQIAIPLLVQDRLVGVFAVESLLANAFDELDGILLSIVANQVASAIDNARLHEAEIERSAQLDKAVGELSKLNETLEAKVGERTAELSDVLVEIRREKQLSEGLLNRMAPPEVIPLMLEDKLGARKISTTILFTDLENFTEFTAGMEPDEIFSRLNHYFSWSGEIIARYRGYVNKTTGDGTMALFGVPHGNATHAIDAVLAALQLRDEVAQHIPLGLRIGLNSGVITSGLLGPADKSLYDVLGDPVNTASRMEAIGAPGAITVAHDTFELVKPYFEIESLGDKEVKGLRRVPCYQVTGVKPLARDTRRIDPSSRFAASCAALSEEVDAFKRARLAMIDFLSVQSRDGALGHNEAVAAYALGLFRTLEPDGVDEETLLLAALLHDVGKHTIDGPRLNERALTEPARERLRQDLLSATLKVLEQLALSALAPTLEQLYRFERGAEGDYDAITELLASADIYDALTAPKLYKGAPWRVTGALEELMRLPYCRAAERPIFAAFVDQMRPKDAAISLGAATTMIIR